MRRNEQGLLDPRGEVWGMPYRWGCTLVACHRDKLDRCLRSGTWQGVTAPGNYAAAGCPTAQCGTAQHILLGRICAQPNNVSNVSIRQEHALLSQRLFWDAGPVTRSRTGVTCCTLL